MSIVGLTSMLQPQLADVSTAAAPVTVAVIDMFMDAPVGASMPKNFFLRIVAAKCPPRLIDGEKTTFGPELCPLQLAPTAAAPIISSEAEAEAEAETEALASGPLGSGSRSDGTGRSACSDPRSASPSAWLVKAPAGSASASVPDTSGTERE